MLRKHANLVSTNDLNLRQIHKDRDVQDGVVVGVARHFHDDNWEWLDDDESA
jgi:hypothetical protein